MTLKAVVENIDEVPEAFRDEYVQGQGDDKKWYLDVDDSIRVHTAVVPLANTMANLKKDKQKLQDRIKELEAKVKDLPEDFDPAKVAELTAEVERLKQDLAAKGGSAEEVQNLRRQYETRITTLTQQHEEALRARDGEVQARDQELGSILIDNGLISALTDAGVKKELLRAGVALLRPSVKVVVDEETKRRKAVVETNLGEVELKQYVDTWAKSEEGKPFLAPATGGGATGSERGGGGANPWRADQWNVTEQGRVYKEDPAKAERLAKAAGTTIGGPRPVVKPKAA